MYILYVSPLPKPSCAQRRRRGRAPLSLSLFSLFISIRLYKSIDPSIYITCILTLRGPSCVQRRRRGRAALSFFPSFYKSIDLLYIIDVYNRCRSPLQRPFYARRRRRGRAAPERQREESAYLDERGRG